MLTSSAMMDVQKCIAVLDELKERCVYFNFFPECIWAVLTIVSLQDLHCGKVL